MIMNISISEIEKLLNTYNQEIKEEKFINRYIRDILDTLSNNCEYKRNIFSEKETIIDQKHGKKTRTTANRILVCQLYLKNYNKIRELSLPSVVVDYLHEDFTRILNMVKDQNKSNISFKNPTYYKYIETLQLNLLPLGNQGVMYSGIPKSIIFKEFPSNFFKLINFAIKIGGFKPLLEMHYNPHRMRKFNQDGWEDVFRLASKVLLRRAEFKGLFGGGWFFDPHVLEISPEIEYLQKIIKKIGGSIVFSNRSEQDKIDAFAMSAKRKRAFENGKYDPASYIAVISRDALLNYFS